MSTYGVRAVISHVSLVAVRDQWHLLSKHCLLAEQNYSQLEKEALSLILG